MERITLFCEQEDIISLKDKPEIESSDIALKILNG